MDKTKKEKLADLSKALGHTHRIEIIKILLNLHPNSKCMVSSIVEQLPISQSTVSQHLKILKEAGWIEGNIEGPRVCYCLKKAVFEQYTDMLNELKEKIKLSYADTVIIILLSSLFNNDHKGTWSIIL